MLFASPPLAWRRNGILQVMALLIINISSKICGGATMSVSLGLARIERETLRERVYTTLRDGRAAEARRDAAAR